MSLYINRIATAVPELSVTQPEAFEHMKNLFDLTPGELRWYRRLFRDSPIEKRHLAMEKVEDITDTGQDELIRRFKKQARKLAARAAGGCLEAADIKPADIDRITANTCTGYICPGLTSYLVEDLGLEETTNVCDIMGMGCGGAIPNLQATADYVRANAGSVALSVPVEICTATFYRQEDPGQIVSNAIFGDGAGALLLSEAEGIFEILDFETLILTDKREKLMFETEAGKLKNVLAPDVPEVGGEACRRVVDNLLDKNNLQPEDVQHWAVHPGGKSVLDEVRASLDLTARKLEHSYSIFENYGNMSSASVVFVLRQIKRQNNLQPGDYVVMVSFGAGFTAFACLLRV